MKPIPEQTDILVVDDTPANLRLLSQILAGQGYRVRAVMSGARALESARYTPPSLILLDIRMPDLNGFEVCETLKSDERTSDIPIIFISALDDIQDKVRAFKMGGVDYITKPFQIEEVLARTETHLALRKLQKQLMDTNKRFERELALAGNVQTSFLPRFLPTLPGWQLSARLVPARETSGDFYDFIPLPEGRLGFFVADVVDKGAGAALFMVLTSSLIRTYLGEFPDRPAQVLTTVNYRLLSDTNSEQFVTVFLGILDPVQGKLVYANAGQCMPLFLKAGGSKEALKLNSTGLPLGIYEQESWNEETIHMAAGDVLVLYTDGIPEALNPAGEFFGLARLEDSIRAKILSSSEGIERQILEKVRIFVEDEHLLDDIALVILKRDPLPRKKEQGSQGL